MKHIVSYLNDLDEPVIFINFVMGNYCMDN